MVTTICTDDKVINPKTNRCVLKTGKIGRELLKDAKEINKDKDTKKNTKICTDDKVINPKTNRCVLKTSKIGRELLKDKDTNEVQIAKHLKNVLKIDVNKYVKEHVTDLSDELFVKMYTYMKNEFVNNIDKFNTELISKNKAYIYLQKAMQYANGIRNMNLIHNLKTTNTTLTQKLTNVINEQKTDKKAHNIIVLFNKIHSNQSDVNKELIESVNDNNRYVSLIKFNIIYNTIKTLIETTIDVCIKNITTEYDVAYWFKANNTTLTTFFRASCMSIDRGVNIVNFHISYPHFAIKYIAKTNTNPSTYVIIKNIDNYDEYEPDDVNDTNIKIITDANIFNKEIQQIKHDAVKQSLDNIYLKSFKNMEITTDDELADADQELFEVITKNASDTLKNMSEIFNKIKSS